MVTVLTIAGSDSSGGAGIQADLKTFCAYGVYGAAVITALTAQNTLGVQEIVEVKEDFVAKQLDSVLNDLRVDAVKIGMVFKKETIKVIADKLLEYNVKNVVLDPVFFSKSNDSLIKDDAVVILKEKLIPVCDVITPNIYEAESLSGFSIRNTEDMKNVSQILYSLGCRAVIIKGGHLRGDAVDVLYNGKEFKILMNERISGGNPHGTGCAFSSALTAGLAMGLSIDEAFKGAKEYVTGAIKEPIAVGSGFNMLNHIYKFFK